jgi:hypothetical protein
MELVRRRKRVLKLRDEARNPQKANAGVHLLFRPRVLQSFSGALSRELEFTVLPLPSAATSGRWPFIGPVRRSKLPEMQSGVVQVRTDVRSSQLAGDKSGQG